MNDKDYMKVSDMFGDEWALVAAGSRESYDACTVGWGSIGRLWNRSVMTVYLHPSRYTREMVEENGTFTVSFFPEKCRAALAYMGSHTGRSGEKAPAAGLTPVEIGGSIGFEEANLTFVCRKLYQHQMSKDDLAEDIREYYKENPRVYPVDENGEWQPHWVFVGEITDIIDKR